MFYFLQKLVDATARGNDELTPEKECADDYDSHLVVRLKLIGHGQMLLVLEG